MPLARLVAFWRVGVLLNNLTPKGATMKTLETYLTDAERAGVIDHRLRMQRGKDGKVQFYIRPADVDGETLDFEVQGNSLGEVFVAFEGEVAADEVLATKADTDALSDKIDALSAVVKT